MLEETPLPAAPDGQELRHAVARVVDEHVDAIINDTVAVLPYAVGASLDADYCSRVCDLLLHLVGLAVRQGHLDWRNGFVSDLQRLAASHHVPVERLFTFTYLVERSALDELALDESVGATSEPWPTVAQLIRRASFDLLGAYAERLLQEPHDAGVTDLLTTLHTRPVFEAVLHKEVRRAERFGHPFAMILFDVDRLSEINRAHGYGFGDRVLERVGILMRKYFREQDWVARHAEDCFAVLLPETEPEYAMLLAERVRRMVEDRLALRDYRTEQAVQVTVSVAVVIAPGVDGEVDAGRLLGAAEAAVERAKTAGRNRVERVDVPPTAFSLTGAARVLDLSPAEVWDLVESGKLAATQEGRAVRIEGAVIEEFRRKKTTDS